MNSLWIFPGQGGQTAGMLQNVDKALRSHVEELLGLKLLDTDEAYQDGIGLETTFLDGGSDELGLDVKVKPGTTKEVSKIYLLRDDTTKIDIEISELVSFSDDKLTYEIDL